MTPSPVPKRGEATNSAVLPEVPSHYGRLRHFVGRTWVEDPGDSSGVMNSETATETARVPLVAPEPSRNRVIDCP